MGRIAGRGGSDAKSVHGRVGAIHRHRRVLWLLIRRDLKVRYAGSILGYLWTVLDPLLMAAVYWFVFSVVFNRGDDSEKPYILFLVLGLLSWQWFSAVITESSRALTSESRLVRSTNLPREIWVLKVVGSKGVEFLLSLPIIALFALIYRRLPTWELLLLPVAVLIQGTLLVGLGLALASTTVLIRDLQRVVRIGLRVLFYLSPVIYSVNSIQQEWVRPFFAINPMTGVIDLYRGMFYRGEWADRWLALAASALISLLCLFAGFVIFRRLERPVLKEL
ncbi:MAG: ABC transporter permease [Angustibacter sp.]